MGMHRIAKARKMLWTNVEYAYNPQKFKTGIDVRMRDQVNLAEV